MAVGETVLSLSFYRMVELEVPPVEEIAGMVARAQAWRVAV